MIKVLLFARLREELGIDELAIELMEDQDDAKTAADVRAELIAKGGTQWQTVLGAVNILVAVNQELVDWHHPVNSGDEVAFFPPVTGG